jgi:hypothetical protein
MNRTDVVWVYMRTEPNLYTVGYYDPSHNWHGDSDHGNVRDAANRVHFLNGGSSTPHQVETNRHLADIAQSLARIARSMEVAIVVETGVPPNREGS